MGIIKIVYIPFLGRLYIEAGIISTTLHIN